MRSNSEIMQSAVGLPTNVGQFFTNVKAMLSNATFSYFSSFKDSTIITVFSLAAISLVSSMAAWVLVRNKSRVSKGIFLMFIAAMCIPFQVVMFPLISWFKSLGMLRGCPCCAVILAWYLPMWDLANRCPYLSFTASLRTFQSHLEEAADIDGCSRPGIFFRIVLPLLQPVFVTVLVLNGLWIWNDYLLPLLLLGSNGGVQTIPLAVQIFLGTYVRQWDLAMTSTLLAMLPIIILYLFAQKYIIRGMVEGAVK